MSELGYACASDEDTFRAVARQCPFITEQTVAEVLGLIARTQTALAASDQLLGFAEPPALWNFSVIVDVLKQAQPGLDWVRIAELLDHPGFLIPDAAGFELLCQAFKRGSGGQQIPVKALIGKQWGNMQVGRGQVTPCKGMQANTMQETTPHAGRHPRTPRQHRSCLGCIRS